MGYRLFTYHNETYMMTDAMYQFLDGLTLNDLIRTGQYESASYAEIHDVFHTKETMSQPKIPYVFRNKIFNNEASYQAWVTNTINTTHMRRDRTNNC